MAGVERGQVARCHRGSLDPSAANARSDGKQLPHENASGIYRLVSDRNLRVGSTEKTTTLTSTPVSVRVRRTAEILFAVGAVAFAASATVLSSTLDWPDILREPADVVLPSRTAATAWLAQLQSGGALLGEHLGQVLAIAWSVTVSIAILRTAVLPPWLGTLGLIVSVIYLIAQGEVLGSRRSG